MNLQRTLEQYANCTASGVAGGSKAQMMYFVENAKKDIATLAEERDRIERNRDMWKGQVERQAEQIAMMRAALDECEDYFDNRADADCDQDGFIPNEEMKLLHVVRTALERLPAPSSTTGEAA